MIAIPAVQQPRAIIIRTVSIRMLSFRRRFQFSLLDYSHGPQTANLTGRHVGDLGNLTTDASGTISFSMTDSIIDLYNDTRSIVNRTFIIHAMRDDGGGTSNANSNTTGYEFICFEIMLFLLFKKRCWCSSCLWFD
jgi:Copper/zinc superoxide dismutase (SODC)